MLPPLATAALCLLASQYFGDWRRERDPPSTRPVDLVLSGVPDWLIWRCDLTNVKIFGLKSGCYQTDAPQDLRLHLYHWLILETVRLWCTNSFWCDEQVESIYKKKVRNRLPSFESQLFRQRFLESMLLTITTSQSLTHIHALIALLPNTGVKPTTNPGGPTGTTEY